MATTTLIPVSEYLHTVYEPDCDFVDGVLEERNVGERAHSFLQYILTEMFNANMETWGVVAGPEIRVEVAPGRYRVPDVAVMRSSDPPDDIVQVAPLICIEVLSPEDRVSRMQERVEDYAHMGVEHIWILDPLTRHAWTAHADGSRSAVAEALTVAGTPIRVPIAEVFAKLDRMLGRRRT